MLSDERLMIPPVSVRGGLVAEDVVLASFADGVMYLTLNRPEKLNADQLRRDRQAVRAPRRADQRSRHPGHRA